jgi:hypothetical protein
VLVPGQRGSRGGGGSAVRFRGLNGGLRGYQGFQALVLGTHAPLRVPGRVPSRFFAGGLIFIPTPFSATVSASFVPLHHPLVVRRVVVRIHQGAQNLHNPRGDAQLAGHARAPRDGPFRGPPRLLHSHRRGAPRHGRQTRDILQWQVRQVRGQRPWSRGGWVVLPWGVVQAIATRRAVNCRDWRRLAHPGPALTPPGRHKDWEVPTIRGGSLELEQTTFELSGV